MYIIYVVLVISKKNYLKFFIKFYMRNVYDKLYVGLFVI